jgi:queuine tRNA-ribosyltransferase
VDYIDSTEPKYGHQQALFPIVQGSVYKDLRTQSANEIASVNAIGNAIGGLSVGEPEEHLYEMTDLVCSILPREKPRYLMGVGTPANIVECIRLGLLFTWNGTINIKNEKWAKDFSPIDDSSLLWADQVYTKAYLRHLIKTQEYLGVQVATLHNLTFYLQLVKEARKQIIAGSFESWKNSLIPILKQRL